MARIGLKYLCYALATESVGAITYASGAELANAITADISINSNNIKLYSNDTLSEFDKTFINGAIKLNIDDLSDNAYVSLLGYTEGAEVDAVIGSKELSAGGETTPAVVGLGFYGKRKKIGVPSWRAIWLKKVQFTDPADVSKTKGESIEFQTPTLDGEIMAAVDGDYKEQGTFSSEAGAIAWLNVKAGISSAVSVGLTALAFSNGTLTPAFGAAIFNYSCAATNAVAITATAAGVIKLYVDGVYNQTLTTTVAGVAVPMAINTNKIFQIVIQESGKASITTTIVVQRAGA